MKITKMALAAFALLASTATHSKEAEAATQSACTVVTVQYDDSQRMAVWCSGVGPIHYVFGSPYGSSCSAVSIDTMKIWESMLQSALLSGRKVDLDFTTNAGCFSGGVR